MTRRVAVTLVNWNEYGRTVECLERLHASEGVRARVLVVDNGSAGDDAERLRARPDVERVVALRENRGYAGGMNTGLRAWLEAETSDPILILTPDVELKPDTLARMAAALEAEARAGVVGPVVVYREGPDGLISAGGRIEASGIRTVMNREVPDGSMREVDWIDGCCMLLRPEAAADAGGFDERYFIYFEEIDLCHRVRRAGWSVIVALDAAVRHPKEEALRPAYYYYYMVRNRFLFWRKNFGIGFARVAARVAVATAGMTGSWLKSMAVPRLRRERRNRLTRLSLHLRGVAAGTRDHLRGRYGRMPTPTRQTASSSSDQPRSATGS